MITLNFDARFADSVASGEKRQTIRRNAECVAGDDLELYTVDRKLADAVCTRVRPVEIYRTHISIDGEWLQSGSARQGCIEDCDNDFAKRDGFSGFREMVAWLRTNYSLPFNGSLIEWKIR